MGEWEAVAEEEETAAAAASVVAAMEVGVRP